MNDSKQSRRVAARILCMMILAVGCSNEAQFGGAPTTVDRRQPGAQDGTRRDGVQPLPTKPQIRKIEQSFPASELFEGQLTLIAGAHDVTRELEMKSETAAKAKDFTQITRPNVTHVFKQGHPGQTNTETFNQMNLGVLDLLIVIDNSGSMAEEQQNLAARLDPLMQFVNESDWRINIVSTDPANGCSRAVIRRGDPNAEATFRNAIMAGTNGSGNEQGIRMAVEGLSCPQANWLRPNSSIAILFVSDEDNCSSRGSGCSAPYNAPQYLLDHLSKNLGRMPGKDARIYGVIWQPNTACQGGYSVGTQYAELIARTGGKSGSICDPDYAPTLRSISSDVATLLNGDFQLASVPDRGSVQVTVNGVPLAGGYALSGKVLHFDPKPTYGAQIQVAYTTGATPLLSKFPMGQVPAPQTLVVTVNGQVANPSLYTFDAQTLDLVFVATPSADADIKAEFRTNAPLVGSFPLEDEVLASTVRVRVNGQNIAGYSVGTDNILRFAVPPLDGATISVTYQAKGAPVLAYPLGVQDDMVKNLKVVDAVTGALVQATLTQGVLTLDPREHVDGRRLQVSYEDADAGHLLAKLPPRWIEASLKIEPEQGSCGYDVQGQSVALTCDTLPGTAIHVAWQFRSPMRQTFALAGVLSPEGGRWRVLIDGIPTLDFERHGAEVLIHETLAPEAVVTVIYQMAE